MRLTYNISRAIADEETPMTSNPFSDMKRS